MQNAVVNVNGQMLSSENAKVSVFDRGYLYGDSLYEVARSYQGKFFLMDEHLVRLKKSTELCRMSLPQNLDFYGKEINRTFQAFRAQPQNQKIDVYARLIVSRGTGRIGFSQSCVSDINQYTIIIQPVEPPNSEQIKKGMKLKVVERLRNDRRALDPAMKSGNYLNSVLAYLEAEKEGFSDALLCNNDGQITEGTTFNLFYVRRGILATPPLDIGVLEGITRRHVLSLASDLKIQAREVRFPKERLYEADEIFLTSSIREVFPVTQVDHKKIGSGNPGPITQQLRDAYQKSVAQRLK